jgi:hypothetical protein
MTPTNNLENPFGFALDNEQTSGVVEPINNTLIDTIITSFESSTDFTMQEYGYALKEVKESLNEENSALINSVLLQMEFENNSSKIQDYIIELQSIIQ